MAKGIVHRLELVEVEMMNRDHLLAMNSATQSLFEPLVQQYAIGKISQRVVMRHIFDLDLGLALLGDVFVRGNPAAVGHRPMANLEGAAVLQFDDAVGGLVGYRNVGAPVQVFIPRHLGKAAGFKAQVDDFGQRGAGADAVARKFIHIDVLVVAHDQPMGGVEEAQSLRHVVDRRIELQMPDPQVFLLLLADLQLPFQASAHFLPRSDVFMGGHPATAGQRIDGKCNDPAVGEFLESCALDDGISGQFADVLDGLRKSLKSQIQPVLDKLSVRGSRPDLLGGKSVDFHVPLVAEGDLALVIEDDEPQREVVDGGFD